MSTAYGCQSAAFESVPAFKVKQNWCQQFTLSVQAYKRAQHRTCARDSHTRILSLFAGPAPCTAYCYRTAPRHYLDTFSLWSGILLRPSRCASTLIPASGSRDRRLVLSCLDLPRLDFWRGCPTWSQFDTYGAVRSTRLSCLCTALHGFLAQDVHGVLLQSTDKSRVQAGSRDNSSLCPWTLVPCSFHCRFLETSCLWQQHN